MPAASTAPAPLPASLLLLADSRLPTGAHVHSGGLEPAAAAGRVRTVAALAEFLRGRLATAGLVAAAFAAAAAAECARPEPRWAAFDAELDARTPSPAQREASRAQGRALLRTAHTVWPAPALAALAAASPGGAHHPLALGAAAHAAAPEHAPAHAALLAASAAVTGPASAAVRLLALDPLAVHGVLAELAPSVDAVAAEARAVPDSPAELPAVSAPALDVHAELHRGQRLRLFES
ncbi:urease accessory protein UreF [Allonocardiopsis opalescens]|uniref:urease accessory protein UreF n=1 Tax=Allonocardiopsis opalescens TaxID=1144618 RepID=UPI001FE8D109|nr:urease accessory UreF family protein [Allonocardiopsis opalescens]